MNILTRRTARVFVTGFVAIGLLVTPTAVTSQTADRTEAQPCYNGIIPGNPYIRPCQAPKRIPRVRGGPADQWAVIACRDIPGCLSWYINNPH